MVGLCWPYKFDGNRKQNNPGGGLAGACGTSEVVAGSVGAGFSLLIMMLGGFILAKGTHPVQLECKCPMPI